MAYESEPTIGYRHFLKDGISPKFAFGHGLGYATFAMEDLQVAGTPGAGVHVSVSVRNTSRRAGKEVLQVYVPPGVHGTPMGVTLTCVSLRGSNLAS